MGGRIRRVSGAMAGILPSTVVYVLAFALGLQWAYVVLAEIIGRHEEWVRSAAVVLCYGVAGVLTAVWSRRLALSVVPALLVGFWSYGAWKWAIHLTDTRGVWAPPMWSYVVAPSAGQALTCGLATIAAGAGWMIGRRALGGRRRPS